MEHYYLTLIQYVRRLDRDYVFRVGILGERGDLSRIAVEGAEFVGLMTECVETWKKLLEESDQ